MIKIKICSSCKQIKDNSEFYKSKNKPDGLENRCKQCTKVRNKEYRERNKEYFIKKKAEYYQNNKESQNEKYKQNKIDAMKNSNSGMSYNGVHDLIKRIKPKPELCEICYEEKTLELASINHSYTVNPIDWKYLCRKCHISFDLLSKPLSQALIKCKLCGNEWDIKSLKRCPICFPDKNPSEQEDDKEQCRLHCKWWNFGSGWFCTKLHKDFPKKGLNCIDFEPRKEKEPEQDGKAEVRFGGGSYTETTYKEKETTELDSKGCYQFTYCNECIVFSDDCKIIVTKQIVVKKADIERWIYLLQHNFTRYYIETEIKKYLEKEDG